MADISKLNLDSTNPGSPVYNIKDELARFERISYTQWQQMTPEQQAAKPYYIYDYPSERLINAENVGYDNAESGMAATQVQDAIDELKNTLTANTFVEAVALVSGTPYTCLTDGYIEVYIPTGSETTLGINNIAIFDVKNTSGTGNYHLIYIKKGMIIKANFSNGFVVFRGLTN